MKNLFSNKSKSAYSELVALVICLAAFVYWIIYAAVNSYFNPGTLIFSILAVACGASYFVLDSEKFDFLPLLTAIFTSLAFVFFVYISIPVWQDGISGFKMYGSRGTLSSVVVLTAIFLVGIIGEIISCFMKRKGAEE